MHRLVCALGMAGAVAAACGSSAPEPQPTRIRIATTNAAVGEWLARLYNERIPGMQASAEPPETSRFNLRALEQGTADIGFVRADLAYAAYGRGTPLHPQPHAELRGVAVIGMSLLHVIVPEKSRARAIADLRGGAVGLVSASSDATQRMTRDGDLGFYRSLLVATGQLTGADIRTVPMTGPELTKALAAGEVTAGVMMTAHPQPAPLLDATARTVDLRLLDIDPEAAGRIRAQYPFYKPALVPAGTYKGQERPVRTVGVDFLLACRAGLSDDVVYALVRILFESLADLDDAVDLAASLDPVVAPATPIVLHPGAARVLSRA